MARPATLGCNLDVTTTGASMRQGSDMGRDMTLKLLAATFACLTAFSVTATETDHSKNIVNDCLFNGVAEACVTAGSILFSAQRYDYAFSAFQKACDLNDGKGCSLLGFMQKNGHGVTQDYKRAIEIFQKACDLSDSLGCHHLGKCTKKVWV